VHWCCCSELIVHTNAGITVKCLLSDVWYFTFLQYFFSLRWNYMCLGIEPLFDLSIFTAVDKVKDCILYNKVWKDNWTYWDTCQYYILYCSIVTIWVHFKWNYNLFYQVLMLLLLYCFLFIWIDRNYFLLQAWPKHAYLWSHEWFIIWWIYWLKIKHIYIFII
jgi:hypothetical protein